MPSNTSETQKEIPNADAHAELYHAGMQMRQKVMGDKHDSKLGKDGSQFSEPMKRLGAEAGWGTIWTRPGLELKQRSLINVALLAFQNHPIELSGHIRGAVNNGASEIEIRETLLQTAVYCGMPTGMEAFRIAEAVIQALKDEGRLPK